MFQRIRQTTTYSLCKFAVLGRSFLLHYPICLLETKEIKFESIMSILALFRGDQTIDFFGNPQNVFRCVKWIKITDNSFYYYARSGINILGSSYCLMNESKLCNFYVNENKRSQIVF